MRSLLVLVLLAVPACSCARLAEPARKHRENVRTFREGAAPCSTLTPAEVEGWRQLGEEIETEAALLERAAR